MSYKVDESTLMAYLYGELSVEEQEQVRLALEDDPEAQSMLDDLGKVKTLMGKLPDQEPMAPLVIDTRPTVMRRLIPWLGAAAAVSLLLLVGYLTDLTIQLQNKQLSIGFGPQPVEAVADGLTQEQLVPLLESMLDNQNSQYQQDLQTMQSSLQAQITDYQNNAAPVQTIPAANNGLNEQELQAYIVQYQQQNLQQFAQLLDNNAEQQREELQVFLAEYHQFLEERRLQDLQLIEAGFQAMQDNVDQQKSETEQILANIITSVNSTNY